MIFSILNNAMLGHNPTGMTQIFYQSQRVVTLIVNPW